MPVSLASVVRELCLAWQKLSLYQEGHPLREEAVRQAHQGLVRLVARDGVLALGVTREALVGPEDRLASPTAGKLAEALRHRGVALVRFTEGIEAGELASFLDLLPFHPAREEEEPLADGLARRGVRHVELEGIDFSELVGEAEGPAPADRGSSLWDRLLERLLAGGAPAGAGGVPSGRERSLEEVLAAIQTLLGRYQLAAGAGASDAGAQNAARERVAFLSGLLGEVVGQHLGAPAEAAAGEPPGEQVAALLASLPAPLQAPALDAALRELCAMGADREGLEPVASAVPAAALLASLRRLRGEGVMLAPEALRELDGPLSEAAAAAVAGSPPAVAARLQELFAREDVDRVHAGDGLGGRVVLRLPRAPGAAAPAAADRVPGLEERLDTLSDHRQMVGVAQVLFELLQRALFDGGQRRAVAQRLEEVFRELLAAGRTGSALRIVRSLAQLAAARQEGAAIQRTVAESLERLRGRETVDALVGGLGEISPAAQRSLLELAELLGPELVRGLVLALGEEEDRARRRRIFDLLGALGTEVAPQAVALLDDPRWFVVRNMLSLLRQVGGGLSPAVVQRGIENPDPRVRLEAVKCLGGLGAGAPAGLIEPALRDPDPKVAEAAAAAVGSHRLRNGLQPLLAVLARGNPLGSPREVRIKALEALGQLGDPAALPGIEHFFRGWFGGVNAAERRAAFASLAGYPAAERRAYLEKGQRSPDSEVRALCARLLAEPPAAASPPPPTPEA